jgi:glycosyltransferase involved in cell wall biosynthesis
LLLIAGSTDGTPELAQKAGAFVSSIDKREFHHAGTRNKALSFAKFNKVVY